jgi:protein-disulfide isomerase
MSIVTRRWALAAGAVLGLGASPAAAARGVAAPGDMSLGNAQARVKVVEYASLTCGHCASFNEETFPAFKKKYIDTGRVHYTLKEFLTGPQQVAAAGFLMARCAGPSKYFKVVDEVFRSQPKWTSGETVRAELLGIAKANGLTEAQFNACLSDEQALAALNARMKKAVEEDGVRATPTFFVNGKKYEGVLTLADLDAAIAAAGK